MSKDLSTVANTESLFDDEILAKTGEKVYTTKSDSVGICSVCEGEIYDDEPQCNSYDGHILHEACREDGIKAGVFTFDQVELMELEAGVKKFAWAVQHPVVRDSGCAFCELPIGEGVYGKDILAVSKKGSLIFGHTACVSKELKEGKIDSCDLIQLAEINKISKDKLLAGYKPECAVCKQPVGDEFISLPNGKYADKKCFSQASSKLSSWDISKVANLNGVSELALCNRVTALVDKATKTAAVKEAENVLKNIWDKVKDWISGIGQSLQSLISGYDESIENLESLIDMAEGAEAVTSRLEKYYSNMRTEAFDEDVAKAMRLLEALKKANEKAKEEIDSIAKEYNIKSMEKSKTESIKRVVEYLATLKNKQRRQGDTIFRLTEVMGRTSFSSKDFMLMLQKEFENNKEIWNTIKGFENSCTKLPVSKQDVEVILEATPAELQVAESEELAETPFAGSTTTTAPGVEVAPSYVMKPTE